MNFSAVKVNILFSHFSYPFLKTPINFKKIRTSELVSRYLNSIGECQTTPGKASKNYMQLYKLTEVHNQPNSIKHHFQISAKGH